MYRLYLCATRQPQVDICLYSHLSFLCKLPPFPPEPYLYFYFYLFFRGLAWQSCYKSCCASLQHPPKFSNSLSPLAVELSYCHLIMLPYGEKPSSSPNVRPNYSGGNVATSLFTSFSCSLATSAQVTSSAVLFVARKSVSETFL